MIKLIEISKLHPHPNNPRKDLGDITELAESIRASGIFQNLTAVPAEDGYTVIIGHRRLAAAKLAGLKEVPCAIVEMDKKTQIATMLLENMQRSDLTVYEQAEGFQMMMDLGETLKDISEKTGFSESTVRRRTKLLELDKKKFKESVERGATLMDYIELEKIKDINKRNEVLGFIGTSNFRYALQNAIDTEKREEFRAKAIEFLETFATKVKNTAQGMVWVKSLYKNEDLVKPDDADKTKYFYVDNCSYLYLYKKAQNQQVQTYEPDPKEQERQERINKLNEVNNIAQKLRHEFVENLSCTAIKKKFKDVTILVLSAMYDNYFDCDTLLETVGVGEDEEIENFADIKDRITEPEKTMLLMAYRAVDHTIKPFNWQGEYEENKELNHIYEFLEVFGYEMSDEEKALRDGTHELFEREE